MMINVSLLILRICLGVVFLAHGAQVAFGMFGGPGLEGFSKILKDMGFNPALFWSYATAVVELLGGLFLILGMFSRVSAFSILVFMAVAVAKVHLKNGFFIQSGGFEYNFVIICVCLAIILAGPGKFSLLKKF